MTAATIHRPRKPRKLEPVHGACRVVLQPTETHPGCVTINGTAYLLHVLRDGYRLEKSGGAAYDLPRDLSGCDCADSTFNSDRPGGCKHQVALRAILAALGTDVPAPAPAPKLQTAEAV